jgi:hypothetical protein
MHKKNDSDSVETELSRKLRVAPSFFSPFHLSGLKKIAGQELPPNLDGLEEI